MSGNINKIPAAHVSTFHTVISDILLIKFYCKTSRDKHRINPLFFSQPVVQTVVLWKSGKTVCVRLPAYLGVIFDGIPNWVLIFDCSEFPNRC